MRRNKGYYWVKLKHDIKWFKKRGEWAAALWIGESWLLLGQEYWDEDFMGINESRIKTPDEDATENDIP